MVTTAQLPISANHILGSLERMELDRLTPHLQHVSLAYKGNIFRSGTIIEYVFFPLNSCISKIALMLDGHVVEVGIIGKEGMADVAAVFGDDISSYDGVVQLGGSAVRMPLGALKEELRRDSAFRSALLRYSRFALAQASQSTACSRLHPLERRCARWLLETRDRLGADTFPITHEFLAYMLGVRRAGVTVAARALQERALINYAHGKVTILDTPGIEALACECYAVLRTQRLRLLGI